MHQEYSTLGFADTVGEILGLYRHGIKLILFLHSISMVCNLYKGQKKCDNQKSKLTKRNDNGDSDAWDLGFVLCCFYMCSFAWFAKEREKETLDCLVLLNHCLIPTRKSQT